MKFKCLKQDGYNLHVIEVDTFRSCHFALSFRSEFDPKKAVAYSLLADILTDQSKNYPTSKYVSRHLEDSHILDFYGSFNKVGKTMSTYIICDYIDPKYIKDNDYLDKTYKFIFEMISNPLIIDKGFDEKNFNIVKNRLLTDVKSLKGNNNFLSVHKAVKIFTNNPSINFHMYDLIDYIESFTKEDLYKYYLDLIKNTSIDIFVSGSTEKEIISKVVKKYFPFKSCKYQELSELTYAKNRLIPKTKMEKSHFKQSTVVAIANVNCLTMFEREFVMPFYLNILNNNGLTSKLYQSLREKNSLCYNVSSSFYERNNYLLIKSTVRVGKEKKAIHLIKKSLKEMKSKISNKEFIGAYYTYQGSLKGMLDSLAAINRVYLNMYFAGFSTYEEKKEKFKTVKLEDIYNLASKIRLNTIYVLKGENNAKNQNK